MNNRFLIDFANPDAGIGHSMGFINRGVKIAARNGLLFAYSENQLLKSSDSSWQWRLKQSLRALRGCNRYETHNIGNDLNRMLGLIEILPSRDEISNRIRSGKLRLVELPFPEFPIPSHQQIDDEAYRSVDQFIQSHPEPNTVFRLNNNHSADYEYGKTRDWFIKAYAKARKQHPIALTYKPTKLNVALHIRRGDLLPGRQFSDLSDRMLPDAWYLKLLEIIQDSVHQPLALHIFSEGRDGQYHSEDGVPFSWKDHFKDAKLEVTEYIDTSFMDTFHHLLYADVLIGSKSGMSHLAGMLGEQIKVMPQMWHSYRGASKTLQLGSHITEAEISAVTGHLAQNLVT